MELKEYIVIVPICLITDTNNLYVKGNKFRDYSECNDQDINQIIDYAVAKM